MADKSEGNILIGSQFIMFLKQKLWLGFVMTKQDQRPGKDAIFYRLTVVYNLAAKLTIHALRTPPITDLFTLSYRSRAHSLDLPLRRCRKYASAQWEEMMSDFQWNHYN